MAQNAVAVGTAQGEIILWNIETGEIHKRLGSDKKSVVDQPDDDNSDKPSSSIGHNAAVTGLVWVDQRIASIDAEGIVIEWDVASGNQNARFELHHPGGAIASINEFYAVGTNIIKLLSVQSLHQSRKFKGHNTTIKLMAVAEVYSF